MVSNKSEIEIGGKQYFEDLWQVLMALDLDKPPGKVEFVK